jgi:hypothetical protein
MNHILVALSDIDVVDVATVYQTIEDIMDEVRLYQQEFDHAVAKSNLVHFNILNVEKYLNGKIKKCVYALYNLIGDQILISRIGEILLLELIHEEYKQNNNDEKLGEFVFKLISHMSDAVVNGFLTLIAKNKVFHCLIYARYDDFGTDEKDLTLLTLLLKKRDGDIFNHMISVLPPTIIYDCLIQCADPFDRFLKWIELYPEGESIIDNVLTRIQDVLSACEMKKISAISDVYQAAIRKLVRNKILFASQLNNE